ncbi:ParB/RepB/Spo0J family partition protein [Nostoc sp. FACHB-888]|jgi:ParB family transcriptional regulator, chromosome partitioning protein|uniref:ParB/RepB/Spo0J family partition protein n=1 Tax=Nostoc sp. FACHB-888 TaxID=2692842 RepID=UPI001683C5BB|nr:ParB/RepB/Spo0J family partition protein [Nostoc sp. FACHB-888]MBD2247897.1 ParB/RepB/Spo0J family partition protein [Nostoc sp. FACHB-888]
MISSKKDKPYTSHLKGVAALLGETLNQSESTTGSPQKISIDAIQLPQSQPRRYFDTEKISQLALSIQEHGILEPLLVRPQGEAYELVAGERRLRAAKMIGLEEVPVVIREFDDQEALQISLVENLIREDLNPIEATEGILQLLSLQLKQSINDVVSLLYRMQNEAKGKVTQNVLGSEESITIKTIFDTVGIISWESFVSSRLPLLKLPPDVLAVLRQGQIEYTKATAIARIKNDLERMALMEAAIKENLSLVQINERIKSSRTTGSQSASLKDRYKQVSNRLQKAPIWDNPKKQKALEKLLAQIESLLDESSPG